MVKNIFWLHTHKLTCTHEMLHFIVYSNWLVLLLSILNIFRYFINRTKERKKKYLYTFFIAQKGKKTFMIECSRKYRKCVIEKQFDWSNPCRVIDWARYVHNISPAQYDLRIFFSLNQPFTQIIRLHNFSNIRFEMVF